MRMLAIFLLLNGTLLVSQTAEPTRDEIARAYRSKSGEGATAIPGIRWERWNVKEIRGWALKFKRVSQKKDFGLVTTRYQVFAAKNGQCAQYEITDIFPYPPANPQIKPSLAVYPTGTAPCH